MPQPESKNEFLCVRMPFLSPCMANADLQADILFFNPGLSTEKLPQLDGPGYFTPAMPISETYADKLLEEMLENAPENMLHGINAHMLANSMRQRNELAAIADFAGQCNEKEKASIKNNILEYAQKILIWAWAQEKLQRDLLELQRQIGMQEINLKLLLNPDAKTEVPEAAEAMPQLRDWRMVLRNCCYFLPSGHAIFAEGEMACDLLEILSFEAVENLQEDIGLHCLNGSLKVARANVCQVLGGEGTGDSKLTGTDLDQNLLATRWWFVKR